MEHRSGRTTDFEHDLFVVHAAADGPFVHGHLLPALDLPAERVLVSSALPLGAATATELERAVESSRFTIVVLSPAYLVDRWTTFGEQLANHSSGADARVIPLLLAECKLPLRLDSLVALDFRDRLCWETEAERLRAHLQRPAPVLPHLACPYPGMRPYSADIAAYFHGRSGEVDDLVARLRVGEREIYIIGPSGSGKSSLVAAGLLPRLAAGVSGLGTFVIRSMRPGERPAARLSELLDGTPAAPAESVLFVIDQLEEMFTLASAEECDRFVVALQALRAEPRCVLTLILRADFFGAFMDSPLWTARRGKISRVEVAPLRDDALREAILRPAHDTGVYFEPELMERLLADAASEPGILPLVQETLVDLWDRRRLRLLTLADYHAPAGRGGGIAIALVRRADASLRGLTPAQEQIARRIFLRLVSFGEGRSDTRRQQPRSKLRADGDDVNDFNTVLGKLVADRLLTADDSDKDDDDARIDLAHEVMISAWSTLAGWIHARRTDEERRRQLEAAAHQWVVRGCGVGGLLDPIELDEAECWRCTEAARELGESADVAALVAASRALHEKQSRRRMRLTWGATSAIALVVIVATLAVLARQRASAAEASRKDAEARREHARDLELRSARRAASRLLRSDYQATPYLLRALPLEHRGSVVSVSFSPDGERVVTASADSTARVWDAATGKPLTASLPHEHATNSAMFSNDGKRIVTASSDGTVRIWDAATGELLGKPVRHHGPVNSAEFNAEGTRIVTASNDLTARIWDTTTCEPVTSGLLHERSVSRATFSPDSRRIITASVDNTARIWDATTGIQVVRSLVHRGPVIDVRFSRNGTRVATASWDSTARVWDAATGQPITMPLVHERAVNSVTFSPDGRQLLTASDDRRACLWDAVDGSLIRSFEHAGAIRSAVFSLDGSRIVTAGDGGLAQVWDASNGRLLSLPLEHRDSINIASFNRDGTRIVTASSDSSALIWDLATGQLLMPVLEYDQGVRSATFSSDGQRLVTVSGTRVHVLDSVTGRSLIAPLEHRTIVHAAGTNSDGTVIGAASINLLQIWNVETGASRVWSIVNNDYVDKVVFSSDGARVTTITKNDVIIWDVATGKRVGTRLFRNGRMLDLAFGRTDASVTVIGSHATFELSRDATRIATVNTDHVARVWDVRSGLPLSRPLVHEGTVKSLAFSADGTRLVTASADRCVRVWDVSGHSSPSN